MTIEMTPHEERLCTQLKETHQVVYERIRGNIEDYLLDFVAMNIRFFTSHGKKHALGVIQQMDYLLSEDVLLEMSSTEALVLLCGAWLHDIGLLVNRDGAGKLLTYPEIRARHPELGRDKIMETYTEAGIPDHNLAALIAEVCYCHSRRVDIEAHFPQPRLSFGRDVVRARFLAALLRLADALDIGENRAPARMIRKMAEFPPDARLHWDICRVMRVGYESEKLTFSAIARDDDYQTADDYHRLFYFKFADLADEFRGVQSILQEYGLPYTGVAGHLTYYPDDGTERRVEIVRDNAIPLEEVLPLEVILYGQMKRVHLEKDQYLFAADWDHQAARLYEEEAGKPIKKMGVPSDRTDALQRAQAHYQSALAFVMQEMEYQPPERHFLKSLETFFALKARECADEALTEGEKLFLAHMHQAHRALDRLEAHPAFIESSTMVLLPFSQAGYSPLRPPLQTAFEVYKSRLVQSEDGSIHHGCCLCTAQALAGLALAGVEINKAAEKSVTWLRKKGEFTWRSINLMRSAEPIEMGYEYTALTLRAFLELRDEETARKIITCLLDESTNWQDWPEIHPDNIMADGDELDDLIQVLRYALFGYADELIVDGISRFANKLQPVITHKYLTSLENGRGGNVTPTTVLRQLLLWNAEELIPDADMRRRIKEFVCRNVQNAHEHPVWAEDGSWGFNPYTTLAYVRQALAFWEYYLLGGGTFDEFLELARPGTGW